MSGEWYLVSELRDTPDGKGVEWTSYEPPIPAIPRKAPAGGRSERSADGRWLTVYARFKWKNRDGSEHVEMKPIRNYLRLG
jgi:hypothetical protein